MIEDGFLVFSEHIILLTVTQYRAGTLVDVVKSVMFFGAMSPKRERNLIRSSYSIQQTTDMRNVWSYVIAIIIIIITTSIIIIISIIGRLCSLLVRDPSHRIRGPGFYSRQ